MKTIKKFASSLLLFAGVLVSCQKETPVESSVSVAPTQFSASFEQVGSDTKVTIDGFTPKFELGDVLNVTANNNATASFEVTEVAANGLATLKIKGNWSADPVAPYFIYSGTAQMVIAGANVVAFSAPNNVLNAEAGKISLATVIAKAQSLENVTLQNASCLLKLVVPTEVKNLKIAPGSGFMTSTASVNLAGAINVGAMSAGTPEATYTSNNGASLPAGTYYIPLFPQTFNGGVKVGYTLDGTEYYWREKAGNFIFQRNRIYDMGTLADWPQPQPAFAVEDIVGTYNGSFKFGMYNGAVMQSPFTEDGDIVIEASDDATKGNVVITKFNGNDCRIYASFDLMTGVLSVASGAAITTISYGSRTFDREVLFSLDEATKTKLTCGPATVICSVSPGVPIYYAMDEFLYEKAAAPVLSAIDFAGTFSGGLSETMQMGTTVYGTQNHLAEPQDFVFEAAADGSLVMKKYYGASCNVTGVIDAAARSVTFSEGSLKVYQGEGSIQTPLVLVLSEDGNSLTQVGTFDVQPSGMPFIWSGTLTVLTRTAGPGDPEGGEEGFTLSILTDNKWTVSYTVGGVQKVENSATSGVSPTSFQVANAGQQASTGCNLYISYFISGYCTGHANFDTETGILTIPAAKNTSALYIPAYDWVGRTLLSDIVMQMSQDHKTVVATSDVQLSGDVVLKDFTLTMN